jgi:3-amino-4-hydroxybenzoic acid synthase
VRIESRPLIQISAQAPSGEEINVIVQDDWHVRVLGPEAEVRNVTELRPGDSSPARR